MGVPFYCWEVVCTRCSTFIGLSVNATDDDTFLCRKCVQQLVQKGAEAER